MSDLMAIEGMSRPYAVGLFAALGLMPWPAAPAYIAVFTQTSGPPGLPGWAWVVILLANALVQLLAITAAVGMYWIPRLVHVERIDGNRVQPTGAGMLAYLAVFPPLIAAAGLAYLGGPVQWWHFALGGAACVVVVPALVDLGLRAVRGSDAPPQPGPEQYGSGPAGDRLPLLDLDLSLPQGWVTVPREPEAGWAQNTAAELANTPRKRDRLAEHLARAQHELSAQPCLEAAVWAPAETAPKPGGTLVVDRVAPPDGQRIDRPDYRALIEPDRRRTGTVYARFLDDIDTPAGPAVLLTEVVTEPTSRWMPWHKLVIKNIVCTVFPPHCYQAVQLTFSTCRADVVGDALQQHADAVIDTLAVRLGEVRPV